MTLKVTVVQLIVFLVTSLFAFVAVYLKIRVRLHYYLNLADELFEAFEKIKASKWGQ